MKTKISIAQKSGASFAMFVMFGLFSQFLFLVLSLLATALIAFPVNGSGKEKEDKKKK